MKFTFERHESRPLTLYARMLHDNGAVTLTGMREEHMVEIADWCYQNKCGKRTAYDQYEFKNEKQMTMFLLRWNLDAV